MGRFSTKIIPDKLENRYLCGETINGRVQVTVYEECEDLKLMLAMGCKGIGHAPQQEINYLTDTQQSELFTGSWLPGIYEYSFTITAPDGFTYDGTLMTVGWYLRAGGLGKSDTIIQQIKQDSDLEGEDRHDILLAPGTVTPDDLARIKESRLNRKEGAGSMMGCLLPSLLMFAGGSFVVWWGWNRDMYLPGIVVAAVGLVGLGAVFWKALIDRKIAMVELRIGSTVSCPGETVQCSMIVKAKSPVEIEQATITLEGWEEVKKFTGIHRSTGPINKHVLHKDVREMRMFLKKLAAGATVELKGEYVVPANAAGTLDFDNEVKIRWRLEPRIKIKGIPDWFDLVPIIVLARAPAE